MPRIKLMEDEAVVALVTKKVTAAEKQAATEANRHYRNIVRTIKETLSTYTEGEIHPKQRKALAAHIVTAISEHAPTAQAAE